MGSQEPSLLSFIYNNLRMVLTEALACLFPSHLAMLGWQMTRGFLVLGVCKLMIPSFLGFEFCPSQQHDCLGGTFHRHRPNYLQQRLLPQLSSTSI